MSECLLGNAGNHLSAESPLQRRLVQHERPVRFSHRPQHRLYIPGHERTQIHHFKFVSPPGPLFRCIERPLHASSPGDYGGCRPLAGNARLAERNLVRRIGDQRFQGTVQALVLQEKDRVRIPDSPH